MQEIFCIASEDWELSILCKDQSDRYRALKQTLRRRGRDSDFRQSQARLSRPVETTVQLPVDIERPQGDWKTIECLGDVNLDAPLLFDNVEYFFQWSFTIDSRIGSASLEHRLRKVRDSFVFTPERAGTRPRPPMMVGSINTRNDIGWLVLPLSYSKGDARVRISLCFEVVSAKLDTASDLNSMYGTIDKEFPLWRFRLARKTEQAVSRSRKRGDFPIMWLAHFQTLRSDLMVALRGVSHAPHKRLKSHARQVKADNLKGRMSHRTAEKIANHLDAGITDKRYQRISKHLSVDTTENRFVKMVVNRTSLTLSKLLHTLRQDPDPGVDTTLSPSFLSELKEWREPLGQLLSNSFLQEVGNFSGMERESQVLHQRAGYRAIYRIWQELRFYLDLFDSRSFISMRSIDEIYEVWCYLELRRILTDDLRFVEEERDVPLMKRRGLEIELKDGLAGSFRFSRSDGTQILLAHEPAFGAGHSGKRKQSQLIRTYWLTQKPDIYLKARFADGRECIWLFDAKYRIDQSSWRTASENQMDTEDQRDLVPEDALNQMHRYRDALIHEERSVAHGTRKKSRPVFGAFALYPGYFDQQNQENPYEEVIKEVGIGAFSLLPGNDNSGRVWLSGYLEHQLGTFDSQFEYSSGSAEHIYVQEPARIPYHGMSQRLHSGLVMVAGMGERRSAEYIEGFTNGTATWYHCPVSTFNARYSDHIASELEFLAIASPQTASDMSSITYVWQIADRSKLLRSAITDIQAGIISNPTSEEKYYWLFRLGKPIALLNGITGFPSSGFIDSLRITTLEKLSAVTKHEQIADIYRHAISRVSPTVE